MKVLVIFMALAVVTNSHPTVRTWTLFELSEALETSSADASMQPYLEDAMNQIMFALFTGKNETYVSAMLPSPSGGTTWTPAEVRNALADPNTRPEHRPSLLQAQSHIMNNNATGTLPDSVKVIIPALDISMWTKSDVEEAIASPDTKPELRPYLAEAQKELEKALSAGKIMDTIGMVTPVGLVPTVNHSDFVPKPIKRHFKKYSKGT